MVVSSFQPEVEGSFRVEVEANLPLEVDPIPHEGVGMFTRTARGEWSPDNGADEPVFHLSKLTKPTTVK